MNRPELMASALVLGVLALSTSSCRPTSGARSSTGMVVRMPVPVGPGPDIAWPPAKSKVDACPSDAVRLAVTTCPDLPVPTDREFRYAYGMMKNDLNDRGLLDHRARVGGTQPIETRPLTDREKTLLALVGAAACHGGARVGGGKLTRQEGLYHIGRTYFDASHWEEAAAALDLAARAADRESSGFAAMLALEALETLARRDGRPGCRAAVRERAAVYLSELCGGPFPVGSESECQHYTSRLAGEAHGQ